MWPLLRSHSAKPSVGGDAAVEAPAPHMPPGGSDKLLNQLKRAHAAEAETERRARRGSAFLQHDVVRQLPGQEEQTSGVPRSLGEVLRSAPLRSKFRAFLKERHASETLMFYESIEMYQAIPPDAKGDVWRRRAAEGIISKFVDASAVYEVNLPDDAKRKLLGMTKWTPDAFDDAKAICYGLLRDNFLNAFIAREFLRCGD